MAARRHGLRIHPVLEMRLQDVVELGVVDAQAALVLLIGRELGAGGLDQHMLRDGRHLAPLRRALVAPAGQRVDIGFVNAADRRKRAGGVTVERGVAHHRLALVAGVDQHPAMGVGQRHQTHHTAARLGVLGGKPRQPPAARVGEHRGERLIGLLDRDGARLDAQVARQLLGVGDGVVGGIRARQQHAVHVIGSERIDAHRGDQARIDAAR